MRFHSAIATGSDPEAACRSVATSVQRALGEGGVDLAMVFASPRYGACIDRLPVLLQELLGARTLVGCSAAGLFAEGQFAEGRHGIAVLAGRLPGVELAAERIANADLPDSDGPQAGWHRLLPATAQPVRGMLVFAEPMHCDLGALLAGLDFGWPGLPKVGGLASGSRHPEGHVLFCGRQTHRSGAVVLALAGDVAIDAVLSHGCRPVGSPGRITKAERNRLMAVDHAPARQFVEQQLAALPGEQLELAEKSPLFLGIASDPFAAAPPTDDRFLVRHILGIEPNSGDLVIGDHLAIGRHVQLHLRDAEASVLDLGERVRRASIGTPSAAVMFRCLGREGDDLAAVATAAPGVPLTGFLCNGEIGPLGDATHQHGYTAAVALLRRRGAAEGG